MRIRESEEHRKQAGIPTVMFQTQVFTRDLYRRFTATACSPNPAWLPLPASREEASIPTTTCTTTRLTGRTLPGTATSTIALLWLFQPATPLPPLCHVSCPSTARATSHVTATAQPRTSLPGVRAEVRTAVSRGTLTGAAGRLLLVLSCLKTVPLVHPKGRRHHHRRRANLLWADLTI